MKKAFFIIFSIFALLATQLNASNKILIVATNVDTMTNGKPTGYWLAEVSHAWVRFVEAGYAVDFASPEGGFTPMDPRSFDLEDADNRKFWENLDAVQSLMNTHRLSDANPDDYAAIYFAGGHGTMWDFRNAPGLEQITGSIWENGGFVGAVCHGPAALVDLHLPNGKRIVDGRRVTGFTNDEEDAVGLTPVMPYLLETQLISNGGQFYGKPNFEKNVVVDGQLVTGQNPASASGVAMEILNGLKQIKAQDRH